MSGLLGNFTIKARIIGAFSLLLLLFAGVSGNTTLSLFQADEQFNDYREVAVVSANLLDMRGDFYDARLNAEQFLRGGDNAALQRARVMLEDAFEEYAEAREAIRNEATAAEIAGLHAALSEYQAMFERLVRENTTGNAAIARLGPIGTRISS